MQFNLTNQSRWGLAVLFLVIGTVLFVAGWTSPFLPVPDSLFWIKTVFPIAASLGFVFFFFVSLFMLSKTPPPPLNPKE
ncbi:MAG: hypothetical protein Q6364_07365 [Candidatus Hermodarchaeota archaeon]|nr:hypothetical protein [Candidatus Hermodarchaeota archaeon]